MCRGYLGPWGILAALPCVILLGSRAAHAADAHAADALAAEPNASSSSAPTPKRWSLDVGLGYAFGLSDAEEQQGDVVGISNLSFPELTVAPSFWVAPSLALGLHASWGFELGQRGLASSSGESEDLDRTLWQLMMAARYQPEQGRGWYVAANGGSAAVVDSIGDASVTQWAPLVGAALGFDFRLAQPLALGLELRGGHAWFPAEGTTLTVADGLGAGDTRYSYGPTTWLGLNVAGRFLL
jgi:hypothetical protein